MRRRRFAEKVSIAVVSSQHGAVCRGRLGAAVQKCSAAVTMVDAND